MRDGSGRRTGTGRAGTAGVAPHLPSTKHCRGQSRATKHRTRVWTRVSCHQRSKDQLYMHVHVNMKERGADHPRGLPKSLPLWQVVREKKGRDALAEVI